MNCSNNNGFGYQTNLSMIHIIDIKIIKFDLLFSAIWK